MVKSASKFNPNKTRMHLLPEPFVSASNILATIDADIAKISNEDFGKVFAGGILVMVGGVLSALIVGFILEKSNSYAQVIADSYDQGGDDAFWNSLSPEDREKAKDMLEKLRKSKGDEGAMEPRSAIKEALAVKVPKIESEQPKRETVSMFNDYVD